jgi:hypothetical protein
MSHMPRAVPRTAAADCQSSGNHSVPTTTHLMTSFPVTRAGYVPLSQRTANELQANANELCRMAATATTTDVTKALLTLADRYAALAANRRMAKAS